MDTRQQKQGFPDINCIWSLPIGLHFRRKEKAGMQGHSIRHLQHSLQHYNKSHTVYTVSGCLQVGSVWQGPISYLSCPELLLVYFHSSIHSSDTRAPNIVLCISGTGSSGVNRMGIVTLDMELTEQWRCHCYNYSVISSYNRELWLGKFKVLYEPVMVESDPGLGSGRFLGRSDI